MTRPRPRYPINGPWRQTTKAWRPSVKKCTTCKIAFGPTEDFLVRVVEVSPVRTTLEAVHAGCKT
jgi:hypothetical protein